jgi:GNAT superfamily N-acetyltransferase
MQIDFIETDALTATDLHDILTIGAAAYEEDIAPFLRDNGSGLHALGRVKGVLVSHAQVITRALQVEGRAPMRTAYVELVATDPPMQGRGFASALLRALAPQMHAFDIAALSPSDDGFYARLGWKLWRGPLSVRTLTGLEASPDDEQVMILRLPRTPSDLDLEAPLSIEWRPGEAW